ncbi:phage tail sheath subtilisin-like domain-containing protein [Paenibacillus agricola]|uniref:Phage tail sheath protein n=1 Tax=Paenibacillus agricola TaxID=2716264 RepID=A0ABX0J476_9BACL|nr:phage tail sheath subtilisin-like domain-containing protein [Paenibacillus agricola]NHN31130.1 phage tail sheath protein [Paenibacillus agricola]
MANGSWDPTALPTSPGLYINYVTAAAARINGGARGTVAIPLLTYTGATASTFYTVTTEKEASDTFGAANIQSILFALQGGAKEVLVYTLPSTPDAAAYTAMRTAFDTRPFNVFVLDGEFNVTQFAAIKTWVIANRAAGKHFMCVFGGDAASDAVPATGNTRSILENDDYIVNATVGTKVGATTYSSAQYAPYWAGLIAGTAINRSITYSRLPADDVNKRFTNAEVDTALAAGSLVSIHDGEKVKIVQGLTTAKTKIRSIRARQAISTDITKTAADSYIGKIDNNADGQAALISAVKAYLETLERANVLTGPAVILDPQHASTGDSVFLAISYVEVDSMERIFLTINV